MNVTLDHFGKRVSFMSQRTIERLIGHYLPANFEYSATAERQDV